MIKNLKEDCIFDIEQVGSKAYHLHILACKDYDVCDGYVLTTDFFKQYQTYNFIELNSDCVEKKIEEGKFNEISLKSLRDIYNNLTKDNQQLIVRSSAVEEDTSDKSYAGIYESYGSINEFNELLIAIKKVWCSYFSYAAKVYRDDCQEISNMAVLIQTQIDAEKSGVLFTKNPVTGSSDFVIEMCNGGNEKIIQNQSEAIRYILHRKHPQWIKSDILKKSEQKKLFMTAESLEKSTGYPCDIEWGMKRGRLVIFQVRPVVRVNKADVYSKSQQDNVDCILLDRYANPASVCYLSILDKWQDRVYLSYYEKSRGYMFSEQPLIFENNRVYWNMAYQKLYFEDEGKEGQTKNRKLKVLIHYGYRGWYRRLKVYERRVRRYNCIFQRTKDDKELINLLEQVMDNFCDYIGIDHYRFLGIAQILYKRLQNLMKERGYDVEQMNQGMGKIINRNMTEKANSELIEMLTTIAKDKYLMECFQKKEPKEILEIMKNDYAKTYYSQFLRFIEKHGHRGIDCDDLMYPHWREAPENVILLMKQLILSRIKTKESSDDTEIKIEDREVRKLLREAGTYMCLRENQRYYFDKSWILLRSILLKISDYFIAKGVIMNQQDIFHMTIEEIIDGVRYDNYCISSELVTERKSIFAQQQKIEPPYIIKGLENIPVQKNYLSKSYKVMGISAGRASGKIKIISGIEEIGQITQGDIVIVKTFHPSWTPILRIVSGLIMNYGNMLSHGAVVAREYQIPVVVFNADATQLFTDGDFVEIDGTKGRLKVLGRGEKLD